MPLPQVEMNAFVQRARRLGFWAPLAIGAAGVASGLSFAANDARNQKRGDVLPTLAGHGTALTTRTVGSASLASGLMLVPGIGAITAGIIGTAAAFYPNARFENFAARGFRKLSQFGRDVHHLEMGGRYVDSLSARASRMAAIQQMNATQVASRRFLGQEALIMHR